jgi:hypothetical protein
MAQRNDIIEQRGSKWVVLSEQGKLLGEFDSEKAARERLRQIEAAKAAKGDRAEQLLRDAGVHPPKDLSDTVLVELTHKAREHVDKALRVDRVHRFDYLGQEIHFDESREDGVLAKVDEKTGFLTVDAKLTRVGVFNYSDAEGNTWGELRAADEVFAPKSMRSFENVVLTNDHPEEFVNTTNVDQLQIGQVSNIRREGDYMVGLVTVTDANAIELIKSGKVELSNGYSVVAVQQSGVTDDGTSYSVLQTDIEGNHTALVDRGRAGPQCCLMLDSDAYTSPKPIAMPEETFKIKVGDAEAEVSKEVHDAWQAQQKELEDAKADAAKLKSDQFPPDEEKEEDEEEEKMKDSNTELRAELDMLKARADGESARIDARVKLVTDAQRVLGKDTPVAGRTDLQLMRDTVLSVTPSMSAKLDANKEDVGYIRACFDQAVTKFDANRASAAELERGDVGGETDSLRADLEAAVSEHWDRFQGGQN